MNWNEGRPDLYFQAWLRSQLNRLVRRTQGYTKSVAMLVHLVALLLEDWSSKPNASLC